MLGTAQWGWTVSREEAFRLLDAWLAAGLRQCEAGLLAAQLNAFADLLEAHIRREERELFPLFEQQVTPEMAQQIGQGIIRLIGQAEQPRVPELLR